MAFSSKLAYANSMQNFVIVVERGPNNCSAFSPDVLGCVAVGSTIEQTLSEMRSALVFHFEGMLMAGESLPEPKANGIEEYLRNTEWPHEPGELITSFPAEELLAEVSLETSTR
jgi:predicted RNase H-like HicB family nuclease